MKQLALIILLCVAIGATAQTAFIKMKDGTVYTNIWEADNYTGTTGIMPGYDPITIWDSTEELTSLHKKDIAQVQLGEYNSKNGWSRYESSAYIKYKKANTDSAASHQNDSLIFITKVIAVEGVSKTELFERARAWFATAYKNSKEVLQVSDKESGELIGKSNFQVIAKTVDVTGYVDYDIKVTTKDGKYRIEMSNFYHHILGLNKEYGRAYNMLSSSPWPTSHCCRYTSITEWRLIQKKLDIYTSEIVLELAAAMKKPAVTKQDW